jgi:penicillin amidase
MKRALLVAVLIVAAVALLAAGTLLFLIRRNLPSSSESPRIPGLSARAAVAFDDRGVATVTVANVRDALRVQGWLTARERLFQLELQRRYARGELAELFGSAFLETDRFHRTLGFAHVAEAAVPLLPADERADLAALSDGINAYLSAHPGRLGLEFALLRIAPRPFTPADALAVHLLMCEDLSTSWKRDLAVEKLGRVPPAVRAFVTETASDRDVLLLPDAAPPALPPLPELGAPAPPTLGFGPLGEEEVRGSNAWAVSGALARGGRPLLASDPHLGLSMPGIWLPMRFEIAGRLIEGVTLPGLPGVIIGRNDRVAWGMTTLRTDVQDVYRETIAGRKVRRGEGWEDVVERTETIRVRGAAPVTFVVRATSHGPLVAPHLALKWVALDPALMRVPETAVMAADGRESLERALDGFPFPAHNVVWADASGSIGWRATGLVPTRREGTDGSVPYDGADPRNDWNGYVPASAMPRVADPPEGFVVTANQRDIGSSFPHTVTSDWPSNERARRIADLLGAAAREKRPLDRAAMEAIQLDVTSTVLRDTWRALAPELPGEWPARFAEWDGRADAGSSLFLVARVARRKIAERVLAAWGVPAEVGLPDVRLLELARADDAVFRRARLGARRDLVRAAFEAALADLQGRFGRDETRWTWGEANRLAVRHPLGRVPGLSWLFDPPSFPQAGGGGTPRIATPTYGQSMRFLVDWAAPAETTLVAPFGVSGHTGSPHRTDQTAAWRDGDPSGAATRLARPAVASLEVSP